MRVIAGKARRLLLKTTPGTDTRPTTDRIKETLFNIINPYLDGCCFLDLFSGSGAIGIEALSRGAKTAVFVDNDGKAIRCINDNLKTTGLSEDALVIQKNVTSAIKQLSNEGYRFDIIYMDPPYRSHLEEEVLVQLKGSGILKDDTMVIIEADKKNDLSFLDGSAFDIIRVKEYKTNKHYFLRPVAGGEDAE